MKTSTSHTEETPEKRQYFGQESAESLVNWLNLTEDAVGRERIISLVHAYMAASIAAANIVELYTTNKNGFSQALVTPETKRLSEMETELQSLLSFYQFAPNISLLRMGHGKGNPAFVLTWRPAPGSELADHMLKHRFDPRGKKWKKEYELPGRQMGELGAVLNTLDLVKMGLIWKVTRCRCEQFFFIRFNHQRFCSDKCRLEDARTNPEARKKRNEYARKLYQLHRSGSVH